ncbi:hypothetical protein TRVL_09887 [Trypanosoma vivax]|nr:hypothetical protein TRVL_09887 [Trypanosoma vivax]
MFPPTCFHSAGYLLHHKPQATELLNGLTGCLYAGVDLFNFLKCTQKHQLQTACTPHIRQCSLAHAQRLGHFCTLCIERGLSAGDAIRQAKLLRQLEVRVHCAQGVCLLVQ